MAETLANLRVRLQRLLNETDSAAVTDGSFSTAVLDDHINTAMLEMIQEANDVLEEFKTTETNLNVVANTATVALPTGPPQAIAVSRVWLLQSGDYVPLSYSTNQGTISGTSGTPTTYELRGSNIVLDPVPDTSITNGLKILYVPDVAELSSDTNEIDSIFSNLGARCIVLRAALYAKAQEEMFDPGVNNDTGLLALFTSALTRWKNQLEMRIYEEDDVLAFDD